VERVLALTDDSPAIPTSPLTGDPAVIAEALRIAGRIPHPRDTPEGVKAWKDETCSDASPSGIRKAQYIYLPKTLCPSHLNMVACFR